jgi:hypothetical protein
MTLGKFAALVETPKTDFRFWHKADIPVALSNVRFWG